MVGCWLADWLDGWLLAGWLLAVSVRSNSGTWTPVAAAILANLHKIHLRRPREMDGWMEKLVQLDQLDQLD